MQFEHLDCVFHEWILQMQEVYGACSPLKFTAIWLLSLIIPLARKGKSFVVGHASTNLTHIISIFFRNNGLVNESAAL